MKKSVNAPVADTISRAAANHIQKKLSVNQPGDRYEQEADRVADHVMSMPEPNIQRYNEDEEEPIQMSRDIQGQPAQTTGNEAGSGIETRLGSQRQKGTPLSRETGQFMETRFGSDFRDVRIHNDRDAARMSKALGANAFTTGRDIYFNEGKFNENSPEGRHLLSHELTHVVQQGNTEEVIQRDGFDMRYPTLEAWAIQSPDFLATNSFPLTPDQIATARTIFGNSIDLTQVQVAETLLINAPTTFANTIRIAPGYTLNNRTLIHELGHVWQYQTMGSSYISSSINCQVGAMITTGDRNTAYEYTIVPGQPLTQYNPEQQATIIEHYYAFPSLQSDPEYQRLIEEVRSASPTITTPEEAMEQIPTFEPFSPDLFSQPGSGMGTGSDSFLNPGGNIPQLEFRFPGL